MGMGETIRRNRATIVVGLVVALVLVISFLMLPKPGGDSRLVALVHDGDGATHELPLDENGTLEVTTSLGRNVIEVVDGEVHMAEADCANGYCLTQHAISAPGEQIICLPHELWVEIVGKGSNGGTMDEGAIAYDAAGDGVDLQAG